MPSEPIWSLDRRESSGHLFWRSDSAKVRFRCEVEVLEYVKDPVEDQQINDEETFKRKTNLIIVCATCAAALAVTVVLPWILIGSS